MAPGSRIRRRGHGVQDRGGGAETRDPGLPDRDVWALCERTLLFHLELSVDMVEHGRVDSAARGVLGAESEGYHGVVWRRRVGVSQDESAGEEQGKGGGSRGKVLYSRGVEAEGLCAV